MPNRWRFHCSGRRSRIGTGCILLAFLVMLLPDVRLEAGAWTRKADINPTRVAGGIAVVDGKIYLLGGMGNGYVDTRYNYAYDPATNGWQKKKDVPTARTFLSGVVVNGIIYAIGGSSGGLNPVGLSAVEAYDPVTDSWVPKADLPRPTYGCRADVVDGIVYAVGGMYTRDLFRAACYAYDPVTNTWTERASRPLTGWCAVVAHGGLLYTFGGWESTAQPVSGAVYAYDPKADTWTRKRDMPTPRSGLDACLVNNKIYVIGGYRVENTALQAVEVYDPANDTWEKLADIPEATTMAAGATVGGKIYIMGGTTDWRTGGWSNWEFDPAFHTDVAAGNVSGTWTIENSPYQVNGEITVPDGQTLQIDPRVKITFMGHHKLNVQGRLLALGTQQDTIRFTADNTQDGWHGVRFLNTPSTNDSSIFRYCSFTYGRANTGSTSLDHCGGAIMISQYDKVRASNCLFDSNEQSGDGLSDPQTGPAIYVEYASPTVTGSTFSNNTGTGSSAIALRDCPQPLISGNAFFGNHGAVGPIGLSSGGQSTIANNLIFDNVASLAGVGISIEGGGTPLIINNVIVHNGGAFWGSIFCMGSNPILINNTIAHNTTWNSGSAIVCIDNSDPILINNILYGNTGGTGAQVFLGNLECEPVFQHCNLQGGKEGIQVSGSAVPFTGVYEDNIDADPCFADSSVKNYGLLDHSPCIGAGVDTVTVAGVFYDAPPSCLMGNTRPWPTGSAPDIGACENLLGIPTDVPEEALVPMQFTLYQNFPNPFNPSTIIRYALPVVSQVRLVLYDIVGREITVLVEGAESPGLHEVTFNASGLSSGVYLCRLQAGSFVQTRKLLLVR